MTDKPKRKNDQPIPRRYWWIFGILAILLFYPFPVSVLWEVWLRPLPYGLTIATFTLVMIWCVSHDSITNKPKRKNDESIPHRYWWVFGALAIFLLIDHRFPVKVLHWWVLNLFLYRLIVLGCLIAIYRFIRRYHWKHIILLVMLLCIVLAGQLVFNTTIWWYVRDNQVECYTQPDVFMEVTRCEVVDREFGGEYISLRYIPIGIEINAWANP